MRLSKEEVFRRIRRKNINIAAATDAWLGAPGAGFCIVVMGAIFNAPGGVNTITPLSGATVGAGVAIDGLPPLEFQDSGGMMMMPDYPIAELPVNSAMSINLGAATQVTGVIHYVIAPI